MPQQIPFTSDEPFYEFSTTLDGERFYFNVRWNDRDGAWYFDLADEEQVVIRHGIKIILGLALGMRTVSNRWPNGHMIAFDTSQQGVDATIDDLGTRVIVVFYTNEELGI